MTEYSPDRWLILKVTDNKKGKTTRGALFHYRVFGMWSGGYLDGDSWRLNSGITRAQEFDDFWEFHGSSGSVYRCWKEAYGTTAYGASVLLGLIDTTNNFTIETVDERKDWNTLEL